MIEIQDRTEKINKRVDDAFTELDIQTKKIQRLEDEVHDLRIFLGIFSIIVVAIWTIQWLI